MVKKGKEPSYGCSHRRMLLACVLILLAFWPVLLTLYLSTGTEQVDGDLDAPAGLVQRRPPETKHKKPKQRKHAKKPPEPAAESSLPAAEPNLPATESATGSGGPQAGLVSAPAATEAPKPAATNALQGGPAPASLAPKESSKAGLASSTKDNSAHLPATKQDDKLAKAPALVKPCSAKAGKRKAWGSFGLVTRLYNNDLPYVGSFIRHYQDLGVRTFYFALTKKSHGTDVREYLLDLPFLESSAWQLFKNDRAEPKHFPVGVLGDMVKWVKEDYIVQVDIDEYVTLGCDVNGFGELVASDPSVALFRFGWVTVPLDKHDLYIVQPPYHGVEWQGSKYLVKRLAVESVPSGDQKVKLNCAGDIDCQIRMMPKTLVHFYARGFGDAVVKSIGAFHNNDQDSDWRKMRWLVRRGRLPPRLRMLAYMSVSSEKSKPGVLSDSERLPIVTIDRGQESRLLKHYNISAEVLAETISVYAKYKANITQDKVWQKIRGAASLAGIAKAVAE